MSVRLVGGSSRQGRLEVFKYGADDCDTQVVNQKCSSTVSGVRSVTARSMTLMRESSAMLSDSGTSPDSLSISGTRSELHYSDLLWIVVGV